MIKVTDCNHNYPEYFDTLADAKAYFNVKEAENLEDLDKAVNTDGMQYYCFEEIEG